MAISMTTTQALNQCSGCQAGWPLEGTRHVTTYPKGGVEYVACTRDRYVSPRERTSVVLPIVFPEARHDEARRFLAMLEEASKAKKA